MSSFFIGFTSSDAVLRDGDSLLAGRIVIGDFEEEFEASLSHWTRERYETQWRDGLRRLVDGVERSCLITSMYDPTTANFIEWWPCYRQGREIAFQNQILFMDRLEAPYDPAVPYRFVRPLTLTNAAGQRISTWRTDVQAVRTYLDDTAALASE